MSARAIVASKTKAEKERLEIIGNMPCYACYQDGKEVQAEVHHIRKHTGMGLRPSHSDTIPLMPLTPPHRKNIGAFRQKSIY
jgi:hypothetical protein